MGLTPATTSSQKVTASTPAALTVRGLASKVVGIALFVFAGFTVLFSFNFDFLFCH